MNLFLSLILSHACIRFILYIPSIFKYLTLCIFFLQIVGFCIVVIFFALMRQAQAWNHDFPVPSLLTAVESNLRMPFPFFYLVIVPILLSLFLSLLTSQPLPPLAIFTTVSVVCYLSANATVVTVILVSQLVFYVMAVVHVFIKTRSDFYSIVQFTEREY